MQCFLFMCTGLCVCECACVLVYVYMRERGRVCVYVCLCVAFVLVWVIYRIPQTTVSHDFTIFITRSLTSKFPTGINHCFTSTEYKNSRTIYNAYGARARVSAYYVYVRCTYEFRRLFYLRVYSRFSYFPPFFFFLLGLKSSSSSSSSFFFFTFCF